MITENNLYDAVPYNCRPFAITHPDRLSAVGRLLGMTPAAVETARVLEVGCGSGENLLGMAAHLPKAKFIGIDYAGLSIEKANQTLKKAGLKNLQFLQADISDYNPKGQTFDYILCHGVFTWIPGPLQEKFLQMVGGHLASNGIAFVSYNTFPGWHMRGMVRDLLSYHAKKFAPAGDKVRQARGLLELLVQSTSTDNPYGAFLKNELELLRQQDDAYLYHEHLVGENQPNYLHEFVAMARKYDLDYLGDADLRSMSQLEFPDSVKKVLQSSPDRIECEQYMDFLRNRMFRNSLLVKPGFRPELNIAPQRVDEFHFALNYQLKGNPQPLESNEPDIYAIPPKSEISVRGPLQKACFRALKEAWPARLGFKELLQRGLEKIGKTGVDNPDEIENLRRALLLAFMASTPGLFEFALRPLTFNNKPSNKPCLSALNLALVQEKGYLIDQRNLPVPVGKEEQKLVSLLDGTKTMENFTSVLIDRSLTGEMQVQENNCLVTDKTRLKEIFDSRWNNLVGALGNLGLLE